MFEKKHIEKIREPQSLPDFVFEAIKEAIINGRIPAGARLKQMDIAEELNVSQQTVREALTSLVATGLVEQTPHRGFEVTHIPLHEQEAIYRLRAALEALALEEALEKITSGELAQMRALLPRTASPDGRIPIDQVRTANREFHMLPVRASGNRHLIRILEQLWDITWTYYSHEDAANQQQTASEELRQHTALVEALEQKDRAAAGQIIARHIQDSFASLSAYMKEKP